MNTVTFGNKNSYADFGLVLDHKEIGKPEPRTNYIDVPARDGHIDLTEAFGEVKYKERKIVFYFSYIGSDAEWAKTLSALHNYLNGQKHNIYFEEDYYWVGRCFVGDAETKRGIREFTVECDCKPYKYKLEDTIVETKRKNILELKNAFSHTLNGLTVTIENGLIRVFGTTTADAAILISANKPILEANKSYTLSLQNVGNIDNNTYVAVAESTATNYFSLRANETQVSQTVKVTENNKTLTNVDIWVSKGKTVDTSFYIQLEESNIMTPYEPYDTDIKTIVNDRQTVTPKITVIAGEPILSWTDKKTGASFQNALPSTFDNKILDFKLYEGNNTITVKGGDIRLTYREASL